MTGWGADRESLTRNKPTHKTIMNKTERKTHKSVYKLQSLKHTAIWINEHCPYSAQVSSSTGGQKVTKNTESMVSIPLVSIENVSCLFL